MYLNFATILITHITQVFLVCYNNNNIIYKEYWRDSCTTNYLVMYAEGITSQLRRNI
jgi:hypothetical protein